MQKCLYLFLLSFVLLTLLLWVVKIMNGTIPYVDQWTRNFVESIDHTNLYFLFRWLTELGSGTFLTPLTIIMGIVLWRMYHDWFVGVMFVSGTFLSHILNVIIKVIVERERPRIFAEADALGYSFPSGHAMVSMMCYGLIVYFITKKFKTAKAILTIQISFSVLIFFIGVSRYIIRVHYLTDVLAGFVFGFIFLMLWVRLYKFIQYKRFKGSQT